MSKPKVIKDYDKINDDLTSQIKFNYPSGFEKHLVTFKDLDGKFVSALPFETDERYYLIRMTQAEAQEIIEDDTDYDDDGLLKEHVKEEYQGQFEEDVMEVEEVPDEDDYAERRDD